MKKIIFCLTILFICFSFPSCKKYMEFPPSAELDIDKIFNEYTEVEKLVYDMYNYCVPLSRDTRGGTGQARFGVGTIYAGSITDEGQVSQLSTGSAIHNFYKGNIDASNYAEDVYENKWSTLRKAFIILKNADRIPDATTEQKKRIEGEAKIMIALVYFEMFKRYGGVPLIKKNYTGSEDLDEINMPRATLKEVYDYIIETLDDVISGYEGYLPSNMIDNEFGRFPMAFAYALKARVMLYAASPLYNTNTPYSGQLGEHSNLICFMEPYDRNRWKAAADAATAAIDYCSGRGFTLVDNPDQREDGRNYTTATQEYPSRGNTEVIWGITAPGNIDGYWKLNAAVRGLRGDFTTTSTTLGSGANQIPLNQLMRYEIDDDITPGRYISWNETKEYPITGVDDLIGKSTLTTAEKDRVKLALARAARLPYEGIRLDPRFYASIIYNGDPNYGTLGPTGDVDMADAYVEGTSAPLSAQDGACSERKVSVTSLLYLRKFQRGFETRVNSTNAFNIYMRMAELYLIRAEANNEYYANPSAVPNNQIYVDLGMIRARSGMVNVLAGAAQEQMKVLIAHERIIELFQEDQRWFDLRRTLRAAAEIPVVINKPVIKKWFKSATALVPTKITYEVGLVTTGNQTKRYWTDRMYSNPFPQSEMNKFYGIIQNPGW